MLTTLYIIATATQSNTESFTSKVALAIIGIFGTVIVALISALIGRALAVRDRRREQYGNAYKTAVEWREMVFRVRRRSSDSDADLQQKFHDLHERIAFHEGWIGSESEAMRRAFRKLQTAVRDETRACIQQAWQTTPSDSLETINSQEIIENKKADDAFLKAVRRHLSWQPWRRLALMWSQRKGSM